MKKKKSRFRLLPMYLMLVAGAITSVLTYYYQYELKSALLILLIVLFIFYMLGLTFVSVIHSFDEKIEKEREAEENQEVITMETKDEEDGKGQEEIPKEETEAV